MILDLAFALAGLAWCFVTVTVVRGSASLRDLEPLDPSDDSTPPSICIIVAVRDGAAEISETIDGLLAQRGFALSVIAVDDRSTDSTGAILADRAARDARLTVLRIDTLPSDWLGKSHACWRAVSIATPSDWLLFVDADSQLSADAVLRAARAAERDGAAHFCLVPRLDGQTRAGRAIGVVFCLGLFGRALDVARRKRNRTMGVGAFTLVRRDAYFEVGGHSTLRMQVVEDMALAQAIHAAGHSTSLRMGASEFGVRWITDLESTFTVLQKNYFALFGYRTVLTTAAGIALVGLWALAVLGPWFGGAAGWFAAIGLASVCVAGLSITRRYRLSACYALATPLLIPLIALSLLYSMTTTLRDGGVRWRETFYPLSALRAARRAQRPNSQVTS